jgi:fatty acid desaturase
MVVNANASSGDYALLKRRIADEGLLERRPRRHLGPSLRLGVLFAAIGAGVFLLQGSWWVMFLTLPAAVLFGQLGFLGHDSTHNQILTSSRKNYVLSLLVFNLGIGASRGWWADKHNTHHAQPNRLGVDPDIEGGVIALDETQTVGVNGPTRAIMRQQGKVITPLLSMVALQIHAYSVGFLRGHRLRNATLEGALMLIHFTLYIGGLVVVLGPTRGLVFALVHQLVLGIYVGGAFLTNHLGMRLLQPGEEMDFLERQVVTARNIRSHPIANYAFGPLSCQIEHHLFPTMPRYELRRAVPIVREFCRERGIEYHETGALQAFAEVYRHLDRVGSRCRPRLRTAAATGSGR